jgi:hypothetical protein
MLASGLLQAASILVVTDNSGYESNYKAFLESSAGGSHTVTVQTGFTGALDASKKATLASYDLVVVSRNTNSSNYNQPSDWNGLNVPLLLHNPALSRSVRWKWINAEWRNFLRSAEALDIYVANHPVFADIDTAGGSVGFLATGGQMQPQRSGATAGTVLATIPESPTENDVVAASFVGVTGEFYSGAGQSPANRRFLLVLPDLAFNPATALTADGRKLLANTVAYAIADPKPRGTVVLLR